MSRFHNLNRRLSEPLGDDDEPELPDADPGDDKPQKSKQKENDMPDEEKAALVDAAKKEGQQAGFKEANDRMNKVFASEHYTGREATAAKLLGKPAMSADDIIDVLADMPKVEKSGLTEEQQRKAAEEGGRKEMQDAMNSRGNAELGQGDASEPNSRAKSASVWARAREANSQKGN